MTTIPPSAAAMPRPAAAPARRRTGLRFWLRRYLPAEVVGTVTMLLAGAAVTAWSDAPAAVAVAAVLGESVGFYAVLAITILVEQRQVAASRGRALARTMMLLVAEFGPAEVIDTLVVRPGAMMLAVWLIPDPVWGLLIGKLVADVVFYSVAAVSFLITERAGLRRGRRPEGGAR